MRSGLADGGPALYPTATYETIGQSRRRACARAALGPGYIVVIESLASQPGPHRRERRCGERRVNRSCRRRPLGRSGEREIVLDHCVRPDRHSAWVCQIKLAKDNLVAPDLTKEILGDVNHQLLPALA